jgi:hypothetical protein
MEPCFASTHHLKTPIFYIIHRAFNASFDDTKIKYTHSAMPFKQMENIATFLHATSKLPNFKSFDLFSTVDLYEGKNLPQVVRTILACKRFAEKETISKKINNLNLNTEESEKAEHSTVQTIETEPEIIHESDQEEKNVEENEEINHENNQEETNVEENDQENEENVHEDDQEENEENIHEDVKENDDIQENESVNTPEESNTDEDTNNINDPEIILIDSPLSGSNEDNEHFSLEEQDLDNEIVEVFTSENPGTFEIEVSTN